MQSGDQKAFELLYNKYKKRMAANFIKLLRSDDLAQDALQDLFIKIWNNRETIDLKQSFQAYVYRISQNIVIDYYRKINKDKSLQSLMLQEDIWCRNVEEQMINKELSNFLHKTIEKLPQQQRRAYFYHKIEGKSYKEISDLMQISPSTINKHIHYAHTFIKNQLLSSPHLLKLSLLVILSDRILPLN